MQYNKFALALVLLASSAFASGLDAGPDFNTVADAVVSKLTSDKKFSSIESEEIKNFSLTQDQVEALKSSVDELDKDKIIEILKENHIKQAAVKDQAAKDQAVKDQAVKDQAAKDQAAKDQAVKDQAVKDQAAKDQAVKDQAAEIYAAFQNEAKFSDLPVEKRNALKLSPELMTALANVTKDLTKIEKILKDNSAPPSPPVLPLNTDIPVDNSKTAGTSNFLNEHKLFFGIAGILVLSAIGGGAYMMTRKSEETDL